MKLHKQTTGPFKTFKKILVAGLTLGTLGTATYSSAAEHKAIVLGLEVGSASLNLDRDPVIANGNTDLGEDLDDSGASLTYLAAYQWQNNWVAELDLAYSSNNFFFQSSDFYETTEIRGMLGYRLKLGEYLNLVPMLGISRWEVDLQEGFILNPGPEERDEFDGSDISVKLSAQVPLGESFLVTLSYTNTDTDLGNVAMTQLGLRVTF